MARRVNGMTSYAIAAVAKVISSHRSDHHLGVIFRAAPVRICSDMLERLCHEIPIAFSRSDAELIGASLQDRSQVSPRRAGEERLPRPQTHQAARPRAALVLPRTPSA